MDAQNDPIPTVSEEKEVTTAEETASDTEGEEIVQNEKSEVAQVDTTPQRPKVARTRRGKQTNVQPVIEAGSGEWDMMVRYAEFYNDNPDENRITVVLNPEIKRALDIIRINCRQFAGSRHHPHQLQTVQLRQYPQCSMPYLHRAQQGTDPADAEG